MHCLVTYAIGVSS